LIKLNNKFIFMIFSFSNMKFFAKLKIGKKKYFQRTNLINYILLLKFFQIKTGITFFFYFYSIFIKEFKLFLIKNFVFMRKN